MAVDKEQRTRALRYKRPALASMGYEHIQSELEEIVEACDDVAWFAGDIDTLTAALDGSDEEAHEFMLACGDLSGQAGLLLEQLYEVGEYDTEGTARMYDDCTVALIGNRYDLGLTLCMRIISPSPAMTRSWLSLRRASGSCAVQRPRCSPSSARAWGFWWLSWMSGRSTTTSRPRWTCCGTRAAQSSRP